MSLVYVLSIVVAILATVLYQLFQKMTPTSANPAVALTVTYISSLVLCLIALPLIFPLKNDLASELRQVNWASVALAFALVGLEVGFLLLYRSGWRISIAAIFVNAAATLLLVGIGLAFFHEKISPANAIGILICLIGLVLVNWKG